MDPRELVVEAFRCEAEGRLDEAVTAWLAVAKLIPGLPQAYERLFNLHVHRREVDAAFCAASVLASLDALDGMARELYEDYLPRRLPPRIAGAHLDDADWALLRHPVEDPAVGDRLAAALSKFPRLEPAHAGAIDMATLAWAAEMLGAGAKVQPLPRDGAPSFGERADLDEIWGNYTLRERLFFAGRAATAVCFPAHRLSAVTAKQLAEAVGASDTAEIDRWRVGAKLTGARAGMLVCGEPAIARVLVDRERHSDVELEQLALFAVSAEHHRFRAKLGIAIGMSADADAPAAPSPPAAPAAIAAPTAAASVKQPSPIDAILGALVGGPSPPRTVRELETALGFAVTDAALAASRTLGLLELCEGLRPPIVAVGLRWRGETTPRSAEALRGRALGEWYVELSEGRASVDARLCARFDMPSESPNHHDYTSSDGVFVVSWKSREDACRLTFTSRAAPLS